MHKEAERRDAGILFLGAPWSFVVASRTCWDLTVQLRTGYWNPK